MACFERCGTELHFRFGLYAAGVEIHAGAQWVWLNRGRLRLSCLLLLLLDVLLQHVLVVVHVRGVRDVEVLLLSRILLVEVHALVLLLHGHQVALVLVHLVQVVQPMLLALRHHVKGVSQAVMLLLLADHPDLLIVEARGLALHVSVSINH